MPPNWVYLITFVTGALAPLGGLFWLFSHGHREKLWTIELAGLSLLWGLAGIFFYISWLLLAVILSNLCFFLTLFLFIRSCWMYKNNQAEIARLKKLTEVRSDQVSVLSHEIRTPLALIKGATELLLEGNPGPLTNQQSIFLDTIGQNCEHLISLAEDLLVQAKIQAGLFKLHLELVDVKSIVRLAVNQSRFLTEKREQHFVTNYPQLGLRIYADDRLVLQALNNLILNASRHTSINGHIYVSLTKNDTCAVISITDDGAGMSVEDRRKLFKKFASGRPLGDGTGLGLVITKQIIELHGGQIMIDTSLGRGTTVLFTLPYWREENEQTANSGSR